MGDLVAETSAQGQTVPLSQQTARTGYYVYQIILQPPR
jgi:hypothetical protein